MKEKKISKLQESKQKFYSFSNVEKKDKETLINLFNQIKNEVKEKKSVTNPFSEQPIEVKYGKLFSENEVAQEIIKKYKENKK
jgi:hypothetical protein